MESRRKLNRKCYIVSHSGGLLSNNSRAEISQERTLSEEVRHVHHATLSPQFIELLPPLLSPQTHLSDGASPGGGGQSDGVLQWVWAPPSVWRHPALIGLAFTSASKRVYFMHVCYAWGLHKTSVAVFRNDHVMCAKPPEDFLPGAMGGGEDGTVVFTSADSNCNKDITVSFAEGKVGCEFSCPSFSHLRFGHFGARVYPDVFGVPRRRSAVLPRKQRSRRH